MQYSQFFVISAEAEPFQEFSFEKHHERIHNIGNSKTHDKGGYQPIEILEKGRNTGADGRQMTDDLFK